MATPEIGAIGWYLDAEDTPHRGTIVNVTMFAGLGSMCVITRPGKEHIYVPQKRVFETREEALEARKAELLEIRNNYKETLEKIDTKLFRLDRYLLSGEIRNVTTNGD